MTYDNARISGAGGSGGGGKGSGSSSSSGTEDPDNLRSRSRASIIDALCEGPIEPVTNILQHIWLDQTVIQNADGSNNIDGITAVTRDGYPDQSYVPGFSAAESEVGDNLQILEDFPVVVGINNPDADAVRLRLQFPQLTEYFTDSGDLKGTFVEVQVAIQANGGSYIDQPVIRVEGKCTSTYERSVRYDLPAGGSPWNVRVTRITPDSDRSELSNDTYLASHTIIVDGKFQYSDTALCALSVDAQLFGNRIPARTYFRKWRIIEIPSNYDPITREYTGIWDGTFKQEWSNNPAWCTYDIMTHSRFGLGDLMDIENLDKWALYDIGRYCDESVPDGSGGFEPRFTLNGMITRRYEAIKLIDLMCSVFRGMSYWSSGAVLFTQDSPKDPTMLVTNANVRNGEFNYPASARKSRRSVASVRYMDQDQLGQEGYELIINDDLVDKYGYRERSIDAFACTSRGQAMRLAEWLLDTETSESETVVYECGFDHAQVLPGQIVSIMDNKSAGFERGGRIVSVNAALTEVTIDRELEITITDDYYLKVMMPDGSIADRLLDNGSGTTSVLTFNDPLPAEPVNAAIYFVTSTNLEAKQFRVIGIKEQKRSKDGAQWFTVTGQFYDPTKYARIEEGIDVPLPPYSGIPTGRLYVPIDPTITESYIQVGIDAVPAVTFSWSTNDPRAIEFEVAHLPPDASAWIPLGTTVNTSFDITRTETGVHGFRVRTKSQLYANSAWLEYSTNIAGNQQGVPNVTGFLITVGSETATLEWNKITWLGLARYEIRYSPVLEGAEWESMQVLVRDVAPTVTSAQVPARVGTYAIKAVSAGEVYSRTPAIILSEIDIGSDKNVVVEVQEDPDWLGVKTNVEVVDDYLQLTRVPPELTAFESEGLYEFYNVIDLLGISPVLMTAKIDVILYDEGNTMSNWIPISSAIPIASVAPGEWSVLLEEQHSSDGVEWTEWDRFANTRYTYRYMRFRLWLQASRNELTPVVRSLSVEADVEDRIVRGDDLLSPTSGIRIDYNPAFIAPPAVAITGQDMATGDYWEVTNKSEFGFDVRFFNSGGTAKAIVFDYIASGYGLKFT